MNRFSRGMLAVLAATATLAGCESTEPEAAPSTVTARAYVDADGSGDFSTGDDPVSGATITLQAPDGTQVAQATTGADGTVTFDDVAPGGYVLSISGTAPTGAVLASAALPAVVAPFTGAEVEAEFRYAYRPGAIFGAVYRDNDGNDQPSAGDTPAEGIPVDLYAGTSATGDPLQSTTTDAGGAYAFFTLRPGEYTLVFHPFPTIDIVGDTARTVTVTANTPTREDAQFTGNLLQTVAEARASALGSTVLVEGVVTASQGTYRDDNVYIQDATGGILLFRVPTTLNLALGDSIQVIGVLDAFSGELEIVPPAGASDLTITVLGTGTVPDPQTVTVPELNSGAFDGELVTINDVEVVSVTPISGGFNALVTVQDAGGVQHTLFIDGDTGIDYATTFVVGSRYNITGVVGVNSGNPQLKPRSDADIAPATILTVAAAEGMADGSQVAVVGVVTVPQGTFRTDNFYVQDATGGILVFGVDAALGVQLGDSVRVVGEMDTFFGEQEIVNPTVVVLGTGTVPAPQAVTGAEVLAYQPFDGELVRADGVTVTSVGTPSSSSGSYTVVVQAQDGTTFEIRVEGNTGIDVSTWTVGNQYNVTGVVTIFSGNGQIKPRFDTDIVAL